MQGMLGIPHIPDHVRALLNALSSKDLIRGGLEGQRPLFIISFIFVNLQLHLIVFQKAVQSIHSFSLSFALTHILE